MNRLEKIKYRQPLLEKWINDYDSCSFEEDKICSESFDDMVSDISYLTNVCEKMKIALEKIMKEELIDQGHTPECEIAYITLGELGFLEGESK